MTLEVSGSVFEGLDNVILHSGIVFLTGGNNLGSGQQETVASSVSQFNGVRSPDSVGSLFVEPVRGSSGGNVQLNGSLRSVDFVVNISDLNGHSITKSLQSNLINAGSVGPSPRSEDQLGIAVEIDCSPNSSESVNVGAEGLSLRFRENRGSSVGVRRRNTRRSISSPVGVPVSVHVNTKNVVSVVSSVLSPHSVVGPGVFITIRVAHGNNDDFEFVQNSSNNGISAIVLEQRGSNVKEGRRADPFSSMLGSLEVDSLGGSVRTSNVEGNKVSALNGSTNVGVEGSKIGEFGCQRLGVGNDVRVSSVVIEEDVGSDVFHHGSSNVLLLKSKKILEFIDQGFKFKAKSLDDSLHLGGNKHIVRTNRKGSFTRENINSVQNHLFQEVQAHVVWDINLNDLVRRDQGNKEH